MSAGTQARMDLWGPPWGESSAHSSGATTGIGHNQRFALDMEITREQVPAVSAHEMQHFELFAVVSKGSST